jgi:hypothetical protein
MDSDSWILMESESITSQIITEVYRAMKGVGATPVVLGILGARGDTMTDEEVLIALRDWNDQIKRKAS